MDYDNRKAAHTVILSAAKDLASNVEATHMKQYYVYIMFNQSRTLYVGVTNDLIKRVQDHKRKRVPGFTAKYNITQLAYYEIFRNVVAAIEREKQIKGWTRAKKIALIESQNARWEDLTNSLYVRPDPAGMKSRAEHGRDERGPILRCAQDDSAAHCHAERSEASGPEVPCQPTLGDWHGGRCQTLRCAQGDNGQFS